MPELPPPPPPGDPWRGVVAVAGDLRARHGPAFVAAGGLLALLVLAAVLLAVLRAPPAPPLELTLPRAGPAANAGPPPDAGSATPSQGGDLVVHVAGAVAHPGLYRLAPGARVADALDAAGGPLADADPDAVNLAARVSDGERLYLPRKGEAIPPVVSGSSGTAAAGGPPAVLDLNAATAEQLEGLPGIGPAIAAAIVSHRQEHGPFRSVEELLDVRGIGEAKLALLRTRLRVAR